MCSISRDFVLGDVEIGMGGARKHVGEAGKVATTVDSTCSSARTMRRTVSVSASSA